MDFSFRKATVINAPMSEGMQSEISLEKRKRGKKEKRREKEREKNERKKEKRTRDGEKEKEIERREREKQNENTFFFFFLPNPHAGTINALFFFASSSYLIEFQDGSFLPLLFSFFILVDTVANEPRLTGTIDVMRSQSSTCTHNLQQQKQVEEKKKKNHPLSKCIIEINELKWYNLKQCIS